MTYVVSDLHGRWDKYVPSFPLAPAAVPAFREVVASASAYVPPALGFPEVIASVVPAYFSLAFDISTLIVAIPASIPSVSAAVSFAFREVTAAVPATSSASENAPAASAAVSASGASSAASAAAQPNEERTRLPYRRIDSVNTEHANDTA